MANSDWHKEFIRRCELVGWRVELSGSSHYKVFNATNKLLFTFAGTPGDRRTMMNVISQAKRAGLEDLEKLLRVRDEHERQERLKKDRETNAALTVEFEIAAERTEVSSLSPVTPPHSTPNITSDLGNINGVAIVAIAPAMHKTPFMTEPGPVAAGEELLLSDGRVVYRCAKPAATLYRPDLVGTCHKTYDSVGSLKTHIAYHERRPKNRSTEISTVEEGNTPSISQVSTVSGERSPAARIADKLSYLRDNVDDMIKNMQDVTRSLATLEHEIAKIEIADEATVEKARQFDIIQSILQGQVR